MVAAAVAGIQKAERLRMEKERTEMMLRERDLLFQVHMTELRRRGEAQNQLELEVDRLYRLNQLKGFSKAQSPIRSLREKSAESRLRKH